MDTNTSIGQSAAPPTADDRATNATTEGVDAHNANEFDARHGLAGAEAKPFSTKGDEQVPPSPSKDSSSQSAGLLAERRSAGANNPKPDPAGKSGRDDTLEADLERQRSQPGLNSEGHGGVGAKSGRTPS